MQQRPGGRGLWTLYNNIALFLFTQSLSSSGSIQFEFEILGNIQRELLKQHQATWCYSWLKLIHFRKMVKLDGFIKNENCFLKITSTKTCVWGLVHTNVLSKVCVFAVIKNASINDSRLHNRFDAFSTAHTKTFQKDSIALRDVSGTSMHMLQTQKALMFLGIVFVLMRFQPFSTRTGGGGGGVYTGWYDT